MRPGEHCIGGEVRNRDARGRGVGNRLNAISSNEYVGPSAYFSGTHVNKFARQNGLRYRGRSGLLAGCDRDIENEGGRKNSKRTNEHLGVHVNIQHAAPPKKKLPTRATMRLDFAGVRIDNGRSTR